MVEEPQTLNVKSFGTADNYDDSPQTDPPLFAYSSNDTVDAEDQTSLPCQGVRQAQYHDVPVSVVTITDHSPGCTASLDTGLSRPVWHTLLP